MGADISGINRRADAGMARPYGMANQAVRATCSSRLPPHWDRFAATCNATFLSSQAYITAMRHTHRIWFFEFFLTDPRAGDGKIGQCAVVQSRFGWAQLHPIRRLAARERVFSDAILLRPEAAEHWRSAVQLVLRHLGPGRYRYGSGWNITASSADALAGIAGVQVINTEACLVQAVDFSGWPDWASYRRAVSSNAKRNAAKAQSKDPAMRTIRVSGLRALRYAGLMLHMQRDVHVRKGTAYGLGDALQFLLRLLLLHRYSVIDLVVYRDRYTAFAFNLQFGNQVFYVHGASRADNAGSAWHLLLNSLQISQSAHPDGKFVMGYNRLRDQSRWAGWHNVLRQRQQCQITEFPTAIVTFDYGFGRSRRA